VTEEKPHLIFRAGQTLVAVDSSRTREILRLPYLSAVPQAPAHIVGGFNFRGAVVPVLDFRIWANLPERGFSVAQSVIILRNGDALLGVLADDVLEVKSVSAASRLQPFGDGIVFVPLENDYMPGQTWTVDPSQRAASMATLSAVDEAELRARAAQAVEISRVEDEGARTPMAIVELSGRPFAVGLEAIREFALLRALTRVPCCPPHILGNMNLRGEVITVIDIRAALGIHARADATFTKVMVVKVDDVAAGIAIEETRELFYADIKKLLPVPDSLRRENQYIQGTFQHDGEAVHFLNLAEAINDARWVVNESL
jgi:purine-binding chemotaxis protein CheW